MVDLRTYAALAQEADREIARLRAENARLREDLEWLKRESQSHKGGEVPGDEPYCFCPLCEAVDALEETPDA